jgi:uncharacterized protein (UPF0147 family)
MNFVVLLIIISISLFLIYICIKHRNMIKLSKQKEINNSLYIKSTQELGDILLKKYVMENIPDKHGSKIIKNYSNEIEVIPKSKNPTKRGAKIKPIVKTPENIKRHKILSLIAGKYIITDKHILDSLSDILQTMDITENIDYYLLYCCRHLFKLVDDPLKKMLIGQYIIGKTDNNDDIYDIYNYILDISNDISLPVEIRMNAVDILLHSNNNRYTVAANKVLESIRRIDDIRRDPPLFQTVLNPFQTEDIQLQRGIINDIQLQRETQIIEAKREIPRTVYEDSQNVHNTGINDSVLNLANELVKSYNPAPNILGFDYELIAEFSPEEREIIEKSLHRIMTDPSTFKYDTNLYIIFQSLLNYIQSLKEPLKTNVNKRLVEELREMSGMCVTGHLSRLINVIQGFEEIPNKFKLNISLDDEIYATLKNYYDKILSEDDELMDDMLTDEKQLLSERLKSFTNGILVSLYTTYPIDRKLDVLQSAVKGLNRYLGKQFILNNEIIN